MMILMSFWLVLALFLDQFSKKIIVELVSTGETIEVFGNNLMITNVGNLGCFKAIRIFSFHLFLS